MALLWNLPANWRASYNVKLDFRTDIIKSRAGREQRIALRQTPRKQISFLVTAAHDRYRTLVQNVTAGQRGEFDVADLALAEFSPTGAVLGADRIGVDVIPYWAVAGENVILMSGANIALHEIASIDVLDIVLTSPVVRDWPIGTKVCPVMSAYLQTEFSGKVFTSSVMETTVEFDVEPGSEVVETPAAAAVTFNDREVFTKRPNWGESVTHGFVSGREIVDFNSGRIAHFLPIEYSTDTIKAVYVGRTREELDDIRNFFLRMKGQQGEFYAPTWRNDIVPIAALAAAGTTMLVAGTDFKDAYADSTVNTALVVVKTDGTHVYRQVASITDNGVNSTITLTETWGTLIPLSSIAMACWMPVWRLMGDSLTLEYLTHSVGQTSLSMQTLEDLDGD